jgi:hypothetical protein
VVCLVQSSQNLRIIESVSGGLVAAESTVDRDIDRMQSLNANDVQEDLLEILLRGFNRRILTLISEAKKC